VLFHLLCAILRVMDPACLILVCLSGVPDIVDSRQQPFDCKPAQAAAIVPHGQFPAVIPIERARAECGFAAFPQLPSTASCENALNRFALCLYAKGFAFKKRE
jgi:hypothetical protein